MSNYIASGNISVFPATKRGEAYIKKSRLMSEENLVGIINRLVDKEAFCITKEYGSNLPFEFNIFGYYFKVNRGDSITDIFSSPTEGTNIFAYITLTSNGGYTELSGTDDSSGYKGVSFDTTVPDPFTVKSLKILTYSGGAWVVPAESLIKFTNSSLSALDEVDGGEIISSQTA